jgi:hypothetical protein
MLDELLEGVPEMTGPDLARDPLSSTEEREPRRYFWD